MEYNRTIDELMAEIGSLRKRLDGDPNIAQDAEPVSAILDRLECKVRERTAEHKKLNRSLELQISRRVKAEEILHTVLKATSSVSGEEFLRTLVRHLATSLAVKYAFVAELMGEGRSRTLALWVGGKFEDNFEYLLADTPCEQVYMGELCCYSKRVQALFPRDHLLVDMGIDSYIGIPLLDSEGKAIGLLVAMDAKPLADEEDAKKLLRVFAMRASLELQRKRAEDERKKSADMLQAIMDNSTAVIYMKDADGRFIFINGWYRDRFNVGSSDILGKTDHDIFPAGTADLLRENDRKVLEAGKTIQFKERVAELNGEEHAYLSVKFPIPGMPGAVCGISTDITERERAVEALEKSEKRLREAQAIAHVGNWDWDIAGGKLHWSDEIYRIFGLKPQEFGATYEAFLSYVHPDDREKVELAVNEALKNRKQYVINHRIVLPNGTERVVHERAEITYGDSGAPVRMAGTVQDISERNKMEAELLKAQKLDSIGVLAGGIAHDFNNLLLGILGNVSVAKNYVTHDHKVVDILDEIEKAALKTKNLTRQLLTFSKGGEPVRDAASVDDIIKETAKIVLRGSDVSCEFDFPQGLWAVNVDQSQIAQVFNNIMLNAQQAMPDGGTVKVTAENVEVTEGSPLPLRPGRYIRTTIKDFGVGIPPKLLPKIFDPFFTTRQKGSGLGLAVSYSIIKKHHGHIGVESTIGKGSAFHVYLPASEAAAPANNGDAVVKGGGTILVMDDEELVRDVTAEMLSLLGYEAVFAVDGREAIALFTKAKNEGRSIDAVILDLTVPGGMGGKETIKRLLDIDPDVKAIVSSGYSKDPIMADYKSHGFTAVIAKPYRVSEFSKVVKSVLPEQGEKIKQPE